jgi:hypothetical protein
VAILGCPARDEADEVGLRMLEALDTERVHTSRSRQQALLASEMLELVKEKRPGLLCIGALSPGGRCARAAVVHAAARAVSRAETAVAEPRVAAA